MHFGLASWFHFNSSLRIKVRILVILGVVVLLLLGSERVYLFLKEGDWDSASKSILEKRSSSIKAAFASYQRESFELVDAVAKSPALIHSFSKDPSSLLTLFESLQNAPLAEFSLEARDANRRLLAWAGNRPIEIVPESLRVIPGSFVVQGPIYSYLVICVPINTSDTIRGFILGTRLFEVNYPINNRFINSQAFVTTFRSRYPNLSPFRFFMRWDELAPQSAAGFEVTSIDGRSIGILSLELPTFSSYSAELHDRFSGGLGLLFLLIAFVTLLIMHELLGPRLYSMPGILIATILIWGGRYLLIQIGFPESFFDLSVFEPNAFASTFGYGLAKSVGDLLLTSVCLAINIALIGKVVLIAIQSANHERVRSWNPPLRYFFVLMLSGLLVLMTRGIVAAVRSAVFDSVMPYNDLSSFLPSLEVAMMLLSLLLLSASVAMTAIAAILVMRFLLGGGVKSWLVCGMILSIAALLFGYFAPNPLLSQLERFLLVSLCMATAIVIWVWTKRSEGASYIVLSSILLFASILLLIPILDREVHERDRSHVELTLQDMVRPVDRWLSFVSNRALDELSGFDAANVLAAGEPSAIDLLSFTQWARSILSLEGSNCSVTYINKEGSVVSDFHIGTAHHWYRELHMDEMPRSTRLITMEERASEEGPVRWYKGYAPIFLGDSLFAGGVWVTVSAGGQRILRDDTPIILRKTSREQFRLDFRTLVYSEYLQGKLVSSTSADMSLDRPLPVAVADAGKDQVWVEDRSDVKSYETFFQRDPNDPSGQAWVSLGMESLSAEWHLYSYLRFTLFFTAIACIALLVPAVNRFLRGQRARHSFRTKLFTAFAIVSLIPILIIAYYDRQYAVERTNESIIRRLDEQTTIIVTEIQRQLGINVPFELRRLTDEHCEEIAGDLKTDFNVYQGDQLQASSKPEMFDAEILDERLSGKAYLNIVLRKKGFYSERQAIGTLSYVVGYRPILSPSRSIIGIVAVPTLYRQVEIDEELTRRNVFLFGAYAIALGIALLAGTAFAGQISSPIRRLKQATERVADGDLDIAVNAQRSDELGDLERAFSGMTRKLKQTQDQMLKVQRELAWREMAKQVAHEIKNPLTPIKLSMQHLRQAYKDKVNDFGDILERVSATVFEQIDALTRIATEFSTYARLPERKLEVCDVHEVLREAGNLFQSDRSDIRYLLEATNPFVRADREEMRRAFINIFRNSVQAMAGGGRIEVVSGLDHKRLAITISDNGPGISTEILGRIFEPNFSTKTDGMGLGLSIVKTTITELGGEVSIECKPGGGASVKIILPMVENEQYG